MPVHSRKTILLATNQQRSVFYALGASRAHSSVYTPYGYRSLGNDWFGLLGFNGELPDPLTGHYHLGNGYRQFNPVLMRFNSPDSWSPFGKGGLNAYAYCKGDPVNSSDSSGHVSVPFVQFDKIFKSTFQLISNRKVFRSGHFALAKKDLIKDFGGKEKLLQLANATGQNPDAIIVKALAERSHPKRLASFVDGNDVYTHVQKFDKYISQLAARRNINHELLKNPTYSNYLTPGELNNLKISQRNIKKELAYSIAESVKLRSPGPNTADFNVEMWNAAIRKSVE